MLHFAISHKSELKVPAISSAWGSACHISRTVDQHQTRICAHQSSTRKWFLKCRSCTPMRLRRRSQSFHLSGVNWSCVWYVSVCMCVSEAVNPPAQTQQKCLSHYVPLSLIKTWKSVFSDIKFKYIQTSWWNVQINWICCTTSIFPSFSAAICLKVWDFHLFFKIGFLWL